MIRIRQRCPLKENRETFFARLAKPPFSHVLTSRDMTRIELMYVLAKYGHRGQVRKTVADGGEPLRYFEHPRGVSLILIDELGLADVTAIILALGHDCDEDSDQITASLISEALGGDIAFRLRLLSKRGKTKDEYLPLLHQYGDWITLVVKAADRLHNLRSLPSDNEAFCRKQVKETREKYLTLFHRMVDITPSGLRETTQKILMLIEQIVGEYEDRFRTIDTAASATP